MKKVVLCLIFILCCSGTAFASDSFAKLPETHWAYDAVRQLAADGIISESIADGQTVTRYEIASVIAKAADKALSGHCEERSAAILKKLAAEFKDELTALAVNTEKTDKRLTDIEKGIGSWNLSGSFIFDAVRSQEGGWANSGMKNEWRKEQMYLYLTRRINENTTFYSEFRMGADGAGSENSEAGMGDISEHMLTHFYIDTVIPEWNVDARIGRFGVDFEEEYGLFSDNDVIFGHFRLDGFRLQKRFNKLCATAIIGRNRRTDDDNADFRDQDNFRTHTVLDLKYQPNERCFFGATGYWFLGNDAPKDFVEMNGNTEESTGAKDWDTKTYAGYFGWEFMQGAKLIGLYYRQNNGKTVAGDYKDNPVSWKVVADLGQDLLKFGSVWLEYNRHDNNFWNTYYDRYAIAGSAHCSVGDNMPINGESTNFIFARLEREWNHKFTTGIRYAHADYGTPGYDNTYELGAYAAWKMNSAISFTLYFDHFDYGNSRVQSPVLKYGADNVIMLRTSVEF